MIYGDLLADLITLTGAAIPCEAEIYENFQIYFRILLHNSEYSVILLHINERCILCN